MPRQWLLGAVFALIVGVATHGQGLTTDAVAGEWVVAVERLGETQYQRMTLQVSGDQVTMVTPWPLEGVIRKDQIELRRGGDGEPIVMTGVLRPREMSGELTLSGVRGRWRATRPPERPSGASREHTFEPMQFHRVYSSAIPPGLRVHAGDTVKTSTVDASGLDAQGVRRSLTGNPLTGPFYVEGAMPGDTLVVKLTRLRLNRDTAFSGRRIANSAITTAIRSARSRPRPTAPTGCWIDARVLRDWPSQATRSRTSRYRCSQC